jgi:hypothetical protein
MTSLRAYAKKSLHKASTRKRIGKPVTMRELGYGVCRVKGTFTGSIIGPTLMSLYTSVTTQSLFLLRATPILRIIMASRC